MQEHRTAYDGESEVAPKSASHEVVDSYAIAGTEQDDAEVLLAKNKTLQEYIRNLEEDRQVLRNAIERHKMESEDGKIAIQRALGQHGGEPYSQVGDIANVVRKLDAAVEREGHIMQALSDYADQTGTQPQQVALAVRDAHYYIALSKELRTEMNEVKEAEKRAIRYLKGEKQALARSQDALDDKENELRIAQNELGEARVTVDEQHGEIERLRKTIKVYLEDIEELDAHHTQEKHNAHKALSTAGEYQEKASNLEWQVETLEFQLKTITEAAVVLQDERDAAWARIDELKKG